MKKLLTIAVPCYNVEWCLEKCLASFVDERILDRLQVVVVNDGGTDGTVEIANGFIARYPQTFSLIDKENGGHGSTINAAIQVARGKYFKVIDADDWVITKNLVVFMERLESADADVILTHFHTVDMSTGEQREYKTAGIELDREYLLDMFVKCRGDIYVCTVIHGITWRTQVYKSSGAVMSEHIFYEDQEYATLPIVNANTILPMNLFLYQYLIGNANQSVSDQNQVKRLHHVEQVTRNLFAWYHEHSRCSAGVRCYIARKATEMLLSYYVIAMVKNPDKQDGRQKCRMLRGELSRLEPSLVAETDHKFRLAVTMSLLRFNGKMLELMKRPLPYAVFRKLFKKNRG